MFDQLTNRILIIIAVVYFVGHMVSGIITCTYNFCPGDSEKDWIYEYEDDDGKKYIVVDGKSIPKEQYTTLKIEDKQ
jgi:hypothetical protein